MKSKKVRGSFYKSRGRWRWAVMLPREKKRKVISLVPAGASLATTDWPTAEILARTIWQQASIKANPGEPADFDGTVGTLAALFMEHARTYYIDPHTGKPSREIDHIKYAADMLRESCPLLSVELFGPKKFRELRDVMVRTVEVETDGGTKVVKVLENESEFDPETMRRRYSRGYINQRMGQIKRIFGWGVSEELVPGTIHHALCAVRILTRGRALAREGRTVEPVDVEVIKTTMKFATPTVRAMIALQLLTGARPGEICNMRACDLDQSDPQRWWYVPFRHKNERFGIQRHIPINKEAQEIIKPYLTLRLDAFLFSPMVSREERYRILREQAQCPSKQNRRKQNPQQQPGDVYDEGAYYRHIQYAIRKARKAGYVVPHWHPNQIRHTVGTLVEEMQGADMARALLGHKTVRTTQIYIKQDQKKAGVGADSRP